MQKPQHWDGSDKGKHGSEGESELLSLLPEQKPELPWHTHLKNQLRA